MQNLQKYAKASGKALVSAINKNVEIRQFERLVTSENVNWRDAQGKCALHHAAQRGRWDVLQYLLDQGASADVRSFSGKLALYVAVARWPAVPAGVVVELAGAMTDRRAALWCIVGGCLGSNLPLRYFNHKTEKDILDFALDFMENEQRKHHCAIHVATTKRQQLLELLLDLGANVDAEDSDHRTPLYLALQGQQWQTASLLLAREANVNKSPPPNGVAPCHFILKAQQWDLLRMCLKRQGRFMLERRCCKVGSVMEHAITMKNVPDDVMDAMFDILERNKSSDFWNKLLRKAVSNGQCQHIDRLVSLGADIHVKVPGLRGKSPIHYAVREEKWDLVNNAVKSNVDLGRKCCFRKTPLDHVIAKSKNGEEGATDLLAELENRNKFG